MRRLLGRLLFAAFSGLAALAAVRLLAACAVAFTPGTTLAPPPDKFRDTDHSALREERKREEASGAPDTPTVGVSLVVGGEPFDAGPLPKAPFPVVLIP